MNRLEQARWNNAVKIVTKINDLIDQGYIIFDEEGCKVSKFVINEDDIYSGCLNYWSFGSWQLTVKDYKALFKDWYGFHPKHMVKIV